MSSINNIAVIGGTGMIGRHVVNQLVAAGFNVTALVRDEARARQLLPAAVRLVRGDLREPATIKTALTGQDAICLTVKVRNDERPTEWHAEREGLTNLLDAARAAGIRRIGYLNSLLQDQQGVDGFDFWVFALKNEARQRIKACGIPYTIFNPSMLMETYTDGGVIRGNAVSLIGDSSTIMYPLSNEDMGRQVAAAFRSEAAANREYAMQGPEPYTQRQAAEVVAKHFTARPLKVSVAPPIIFRLLGTFVPALNYLYKLTYALNHYSERFQSEDTWRELGKPTTTLAQFAAQAKG